METIRAQDKQRNATEKRQGKKDKKKEKRKKKGKPERKKSHRIAPDLTLFIESHNIKDDLSKTTSVIVHG